MQLAMVVNDKLKQRLKNKDNDIEELRIEGEKLSQENFKQKKLYKQVER